MEPQVLAGRHIEAHLPMAFGTSKRPTGFRFFCIRDSYYSLFVVGTLIASKQTLCVKVNSQAKYVSPIFFP